MVEQKDKIGAEININNFGPPSGHCHSYCIHSSYSPELPGTYCKYHSCQAKTFLNVKDNLIIRILLSQFYHKFAVIQAKCNINDISCKGWTHIYHIYFSPQCYMTPVYLMTN